MSRMKESGQSLFEVMVALLVITLIIVSLVAIASTSIRNAGFSKSQALATRYAQEANEWVRGQRDAGWDTFITRATLAPGTTWCISTLSWNSIGSCGSTNTISGTVFRREVTLTTIDSTNIQAQIKVYWDDSLGRHEVNVITNLTNWNTT